MGIDLGEGFILVKIRAVPQTLAALRLSMDDFTLVSRKNGEKSGAMSPHAIAGSGAMVIGDVRAQSGQGIGTPEQSAGDGRSVRMPGRGGGIRYRIGTGRHSRRSDGAAHDGGSPALPFLEAKAFQDVETKEPMERLALFQSHRQVQGEGSWTDL